MDPGFTEYSDHPGVWFYWNTVPGAVVTGVAGYPLNNWGSNAVIYCGNASVFNNDPRAVGSKIYGNSKANIIDNNAANVYINAGAGNDTLGGGGFNVTMHGGAGNDYISNGGNNVKIYGEAGNDYIENNREDVTIDGGANNDRIKNTRSNVKIFGGTGNDSIQSGGDDVTIDGGTGDDTVMSYGVNVLFKYSGGNDSINGLNSTSTLQIASGKVSSVIRFVDNINDLCVAVGNDTITLAGVSDENINLVDSKGKKIDYTLHVVGTNEDDYIYSGYGAKTFIHGEAGDDTIENFYSYVIIDGGAGNDSITNNGDKVSILGGEDDDYIWNGQSDYYPTKGDKASIDAGAGDNQVSLIGAGKTISVDAGEGNDSIFALSFDEDVHFNQNAYTVGNGSKITIDAGGGRNLVSVGSGWSYVTINGGDEKDIVVNSANKAIIKTGALNDLIKNYGSNVTIDGGEDFDTIINFGSKVSINGGDGTRNSENYIYSDAVNVTINGGKNDDRILVYNDIVASVNAGEGNDYIMLQRVQWKDILNSFGDAVIGVPKSLLEENVEKVAVDYTKEWLKKELLNETLGTVLENVSKVVGVVKNVAGWFDIIESYYKKTSASSTIIGGKGNDIIVNDGVAPRTFEYSDGDGNDTIYYFNTNKALKANLNLDAQSLFLSTLHIKKGLVKEVALDGNDVIIKVGKGSVRLVDGVGKKFKLREADGYTTTRAYDRNSDGEIICTIFGSSKNDELWDNVGFKKQSYIVAPGTPTPKGKIIGTVNKNVIYGNGGKDTLRANDKNSSLYGGAKNDILYGGDGADYLDGGSGNDTLIGGKGNNTLSGGTGKDSLIGGINNDSLLGGDNNDTLYGGNGKDKLYGNDGDDKLFGDNGNDKLYGEGDNDKLYGNDGDDWLYGGDGKDSLYGGSDKDKLYGDEGNDFLDGGDSADALFGGIGNDKLYGGIGDDTLYGGKDNDTLWGESGADRFIYDLGDGNDVICGFENDDLLKIMTSFETSYSKKKNCVTFKMYDNGSITLKNFTATSFHVNSDVYQIVDNKFVKK